MNEQIDELIAEIAKKHGVALSRDDPILVMQTINSRLMSDSAQAQQLQLNKFKEDLEAISTQWQHDAKHRAEGILNASLSAGNAVLSHATRDSANAITGALRLEVDAAAARLAASMHETRRVAAFNVFASCLTVAAAAIVLWSLLR
jgi:hypothetical protein